MAGAGGGRTAAGRNSRSCIGSIEWKERGNIEAPVRRLNAISSNTKAAAIAPACDWLSSGDPSRNVVPRCLPLVSTSRRARCRSSVMERAGNRTRAKSAVQATATSKEHRNWPRDRARHRDRNSPSVLINHRKLSRCSTARILAHHCPAKEYLAQSTSQTLKPRRCAGC